MPRGASTPLQQSISVPAHEERHARKPAGPAAGDSRSFPGQPTPPGTSGAAIRANRSLSDDRSKVLSLASLPNHSMDEEDEEEPLLKSAWMSIVGAAGKFLGRAQERHQWSDARVGMMNRLLSQNRSGSAGSFHTDEDAMRGGKLQRHISVSKTSASTLAPADHELSHSISTRGGGAVSISAATRGGTEWGDAGSVGSVLPHIDHRASREAGYSERSIPQVLPLGHSTYPFAAGINSRQPSGDALSPGWPPGRASADQGLDMFEGRRVQFDARKRQPEDMRQSCSGSNSTRGSIPTMPPLPRQPSQQHLQVGADGGSGSGEDHLHGLLNKLRARRLNQDAGAELQQVVTPRRYSPHSPHDPNSPDPYPPRRQLASMATSAGTSRLMRQRFSALLASDLERQNSKPSEATRPRYSALVGLGASVCDSATTERVSTWLEAACAVQAEPPPENSASLLEADPMARASSEAASLSRHESTEADTESMGADGAGTFAAGARRITHLGVDDGAEARAAECRPWKSMSGAPRLNGGEDQQEHAGQKGEVSLVPHPPSDMPRAPAPARGNSQRVHFSGMGQPLSTQAEGETH